MSRRQLMFNISSSDYESGSFGMDFLPLNNDVKPRCLTFDYEDSNDSGFESHDSENEMSPRVETRRSVGYSLSPSSKRSCDDNEMDFRSKKPMINDCIQPCQTFEPKVSTDSVKTAVDRMDTEADLIGDGSHTQRLQTVSGRHKDLKSVSPHTVSQLLDWKYSDVISGFQIIDCRYPYEYQGGHIEGAVNLHTEAMITDLISRLQNSECTSRNILIFHCEFSSERGPKLLRHLRSMDRKLNSDRYPFLFYPEVYLLDGGYKAFYQQHQIQCEPRNYLPMLHGDFSKQLRHFRVKSKSWTAGEKQSMRSRCVMMEMSPLKMSWL